MEVSWTAPPGSPLATTYALEIGTLPGQSNLGTLVLAPQPALSVPAVPAGRYYVRVRAHNVAGASDVSNELVVDVP